MSSIQHGCGIPKVPVWKAGDPRTKHHYLLFNDRYCYDLVIKYLKKHNVLSF